MKIMSAALSIWLLAFLPTAYAQDVYPSSQVRLVTPFAPGGGSDLVTRVLADALHKQLKQPVVVQNIAGAGGTVGSQAVAQAKPDGYTLLLHHIGMATAPALFKNLPFDPLKSFEPVGLFADMPMIIVSGTGFSPKTMKDLIDYVKKKKSAVTFASSGAGSATHLCALMFQSMVGEDVTMVQYRGAAPALIDVQSGRVDLLCDVTGGIVSHIKSGNVKAFVLTADSLLESLPDLPTTTELGITGLDISAWYGLYAPANTPSSVVEKLEKALQAAVQDPTVRQRLRDMDTLAFGPAMATPEAHRERLSQQIDTWTNVLNKAGIVAQ